MHRNREDRDFLAGFISWWKDYFHVLVLSVTRISRDNVNIMASGMVYSTLIALIPGVTFLFVVFSSFGVLQPFVEMLSDFLVETLGETNGAEVIRLLEVYTGNAMSLGIVGLVSFVITSIFLMNKIHSVVCRIFRTPPRNGALKRFMMILTFLIVSAFLMVVLMTLQTTMGNYISQNLFAGMAKDANDTGLWRNLLIIAVIWICMFLIILILPNARIRKSSAAVGVTTGTVLAIVATSIFKLVTRFSVSYSVIYGSLASLLFFLLYLYIIWFIFMVSCEITYVHQFRPEKGMIQGRPDSPSRHISEGLTIVLMVADKYRKGSGFTTDRELIRRLSIPTSKLYGYLSLLEDNHILMPVNPQRTAFVPALPLDRISVKEVVSILYGTLREEEVVTLGEALSLDIAEKGIDNLGDLTLENLMERL